SNTLEHTSESIIGRHPSATTASFLGAIDEVRVYDHALELGEIQAAMRGSAALSSSLNPKHDAIDVLRDRVLGWKPGEFAAKHNVYLGTSFEDVNSATVSTLSDLDVNSFDPGRLEFGTSYFWRVDEVNGTPDKTVYRGDVWSFEVEPYSIEIPGTTIAVTASSSSNEFSVPQKTLDGSGLAADESHSIGPETMWFTASVDLDSWIQYEFLDVQKLDVMRVWNSNSSAEMAIGWGVKDVIIEYSVDGENWDAMEEVSQFSRASGSPTYGQYDEVDLGGLAARYVRLDIQSNWGGILMSYSLSEVQFYMIPAAARTPEPASGSVDIAPNSTIGWRAGRDVTQHVITISTDVNAVIDGLANSVTSSTNNLDLNSLDLQLGRTYYWRVDEANEADAVSVWAGPVWSFSTVAALTVDDFESYNNISPDRPFQTWLDGFGYSADEFFPVGYSGNGTGAGIGHDIWSLSSSYYDDDIMETGNTLPGSSQSLPFYYTNTGGVASQTERSFSATQDWTVGGAKTLSIAFFGQAGNTGTLYVEINNTKIIYPYDAANIAKDAWQAWNIDLSSMDVESVTTLQIGVDGSGASGLLLIDDIRLYPEPGK
ncbi:MAG: discoidin domain-containing protein, partial [Phycisphaeraceae bacterium]|nr:discoidin domain-containing protein [Phycisphaeraceae bacterium]